MANFLGKSRFLAALLLGGCAAASLLGEDGDYEVSEVSQRGSYLDAVLRSSDEVLRLYFPGDERCRESVVPGARVEYLAVGRLGSVRHAGHSCEAVGVASLRAWMSRRPRPRVGQKPRAQAVYRLFYEDSEVLFARGDFPLARLIGWSGASDLVAVLGRSEACRAAVARGLASMEFSASAPQPFWLLAAGARCPIQGFVQPPASAAVS